MYFLFALPMAFDINNHFGEIWNAKGKITQNDSDQTVVSNESA